MVGADEQAVVVVPQVNPAPANMLEMKVNVPVIGEMSVMGLGLTALALYGAYYFLWEE